RAPRSARSSSERRRARSRSRGAPARWAERPKLREILSRASLHAQAFDRNAADEMVLDDLAHMVDLDPAVPDLLGIDHDGDPARALIQTAGRVRAHAALDAALVQQALELVAH